MHLRDGPAVEDTVSRRYAALVQSSQLTRDPEQERIARALDQLADALRARTMASKSSALGWLFAKKSGADQVPRGVYIHGGVGRGKTMLMDMFFETAPARAKRRLHFNDFMTEAHDRIQKQRQARKDGLTKEDDPIPPVARQLAEGAQLLCFDEFSVTDIADAMVLSRLFSALFAQGVVLVATSNVAPDDLYRDGLNRALFEPFIGLLKKHAQVMALDAGTDYRMEKLNRLPVYITPLGPEADRAMDEAWATITNGKRAGPGSLTVMGRQVHVPAMAGEAARFSFADLCDEALGARDYLAIAERFNSMLIDRIPVLDQTRRNPAKRFILLIDTLYDKGIRLVASAEAAPDQLYAGRAGITEAFEFARTASRLNEMQSRDWLDEWSKRRG